MFECKECGAQSCVPCDCPHSGQTCDEYRLSNQSQAEEEEKTLATIREKSKTCPNCAIAVQWADGCEHVTCQSQTGIPPSRSCPSF